MKLNSRRLKIELVFILVLFFTSVNAQVNYSFIEHLSVNNLQREHLTYLRGIPNSSPDSLNYLKAKYYLQYFDASLFMEYYLKSKNLIINDINALTIANIRFLNEPPSLQQLWFDSYNVNDVSKENRMIRDTYLASVNPFNVDHSILPNRLQTSFSNHVKNSRKKPMVGAMLSTLVPGLGKLYVGKKRSFMMTLFTHLVSGVQSYEAMKKLGVNHAFSIFSISFFGVFYAANIYSGYHDVKKVKKESKTQFLIDASDYYNFNFSNSLY